MHSKETPITRLTLTPRQNSTVPTICSSSYAARSRRRLRLRRRNGDLWACHTGKCVCVFGAFISCRCVIYGWPDDIYAQAYVCNMVQTPLSRRGDSDSQFCRIQHTFGTWPSERKVKPVSRGPRAMCGHDNRTTTHAPNVWYQHIYHTYIHPYALCYVYVVPVWNTRI